MRGLALGLGMMLRRALAAAAPSLFRGLLAEDGKQLVTESGVRLVLET